MNKVRFRSIQEQAVFKPETGLTPEENLKLWIDEPPFGKNYLIHALAHIDAKLKLDTTATMDESTIKAHGLTDILFFISKKVEMGCTIEEISSELLSYIEKTINTLFDIDFATMRVERMLKNLNKYEQLNQKSKLESGSKQILRLIKLIRSQVQRYRKTKTYFDLRQILTKSFPPSSLLEMHLTLIYQEAYSLCYTFGVIFDVLEIPDNHTIRLLLKNRWETLEAKFQPYSKITQAASFERFNETLDRNLDSSFRYKNGNYSEPDIKTIRAVVPTALHLVYANN